MALTIRRPFSNHITFSPVDYRFLNSASSAPNVILTTNGIESVCTGSCSYNFNDQFNVTSNSISGNVLSLAISDPNNVLTVDNLKVTAQGLPCVTIAGSTLSSFTCTLTSDTNGIPRLIAGDLMISVYAGQLGFAGVDSAVTALTFALVATSLSKTTGGKNGGYYNTLTGKGFPLDSKLISITICSKVANIITISNTEIQFYMPSCNNEGV